MCYLLFVLFSLQSHSQFLLGFDPNSSMSVHSPGASCTQGPSTPPRLTLLYFLLCNLIKCKFVWEYAQIRHSIKWTDGASFFSPSDPLLSSLASLLCRNSGLVTQQLFLL